MTPHTTGIDTAIIAAFWWSKSRADIACMLHTNADHVKRVWAKAKTGGILPDIARPSNGFDPRISAMEIAKHSFPQTAFIVPFKTDRQRSSA